MKDSNISRAIINRLPRYYRYLEELKAEGTERISSQELSKRMGVTASQIRQDLNHFGGFGQQGYGYKVDLLYREIGRILGLDEPKYMIQIGAGNLGQALTNYISQVNRGFVIESVFDKDPGRIGMKVQGIEVRDIAELESYIASHKVDIAVLTIPKDQAPEITDRLIGCGVSAIWNFSHTDLSVPADVAVENVYLNESLMGLSYRVTHKNETELE